MNSLHVAKHPCAPAGDEAYGKGDTGSTGKITEAKEAVTRAARNTSQQIKTAAAETVSRAKETAERVATEKKEQTANRIGGYSSAIHESAKSLEEQDPNIAWFTHQAADRLQRVADYVRTQDFTALRRDGEDFARRHPGAFFGGMFAVGLVVGNLMKASRRKIADDTSSFGGENLETGETGWQPTSVDPLQTPGSAPDFPAGNQPTGF